MQTSLQFTGYMTEVSRTIQCPAQTVINQRLASHFYLFCQFPWIGVYIKAWVSFDIPLYKSDVIKSLKSNRVYILILLCLFDLLIAIEFSFQQVQVIL